VLRRIGIDTRRSDGEVGRLFTNGASLD